MFTGSHMLRRPQRAKTDALVRTFHMVTKFSFHCVTLSQHTDDCVRVYWLLELHQHQQPELYLPPPCASTLKVSKTTVTRAHVLRQGSACARRAVPKERMSPGTCPYLIHMLALWGSLWGRLGFRFWNGFRLPIAWDKTVINNIFGKVKLALKHMAKGPKSHGPLWPTQSAHMFTGGPDVRNSHARCSNMSHG